MKWLIMFRYNGRTEIIDSADTEEEANYLLAEYQLANHGSGARVWKKYGRDDR